MLPRGRILNIEVCNDTECIYGRPGECLHQEHVYTGSLRLIPALLVSFYMFGLGAVVVTLTSVAACVFFEWAITKFI